MGAYSIILCQTCREHDPEAWSQKWSLGLEIIKQNRSEWLDKHSGHELIFKSDAHGQFSASDWDYNTKSWSEEFYRGQGWG